MQILVTASESADIEITASADADTAESGDIANEAEGASMKQAEDGFPDLFKIYQTKEAEYVNDSYSFETIDNSKSFSGTYHTIELDNHYKCVVFEGDSEAIKKINREIKSIAESYISDGSGAFEYAKADVDLEYTSYGTYIDYAKQKVTHMSDDYVSICVENDWCAGGVGNCWSDGGLTFALGHMGISVIMEIIHTLLKCTAESRGMSLSMRIKLLSRRDTHRSFR